MRIFNSLSERVEPFVPLNPLKIGVYTCGPTVYDYPTIGNWRTYLLGDIVVRVLEYLNYDVDYLMNITDVGHLTGDNLGDADSGEDRMEKGAKREGKSAWDVAEFFTKDFLDGYKKLNLTEPIKFAKATDHIAEQIELVRNIEKKGFAYKISDGVYFDTQAYEKSGQKYGELSTLDKIEEGARVAKNPEKKDPRDFALWRFNTTGKKRDMEWDSPWGRGFPGWHVECSAMSMKYLGEQFDIHIGGEDLRTTHHPNEMAQSESSSGKKPFVKYWIHGLFLLIDGGRMGKSKGNAYTLQDIEKKGFDPLALRYFYLTGHYRKRLNFTWESMKAAQTGLNRLRGLAARYKGKKERVALSSEKLSRIDRYRDSFVAAVENDLNMPEALAIAWELVKSNVPDRDKYDLLLNFDQILGLGLREYSHEFSLVEAPDEVRKLIDKRNRLRDEKKYEEADRIRKQVEEMGYKLDDEKGSTQVRKVIKAN